MVAHPLHFAQDSQGQNSFTNDLIMKFSNKLNYKVIKKSTHINMTPTFP